MYFIVHITVYISYTYSKTKVYIFISYFWNSGQQIRIWDGQT